RSCQWHACVRRYVAIWWFCGSSTAASPSAAASLTRGSFAMRARALPSPVFISLLPRSTSVHCSDAPDVAAVQQPTPWSGTVPTLSLKVVPRTSSTAPLLKPAPMTVAVPLVVVAVMWFPLMRLSLMVMLRPLPTLPPPLLALAVPLGAVAVTVLPVMWVFLIVSIPPVPTPAESAHAQAVDAAGTVALTWLLLTVLSASVSWPSSQVPPQKAT